MIHLCKCFVMGFIWWLGDVKFSWHVVGVCWGWGKWSEEGFKSIYAFCICV